TTKRANCFPSVRTPAPAGRTRRDSNLLPYAFRIVGPTWERRRPVLADVAFRAYAACDDRAQVEREAYLSAFCFGLDFYRLLESTGSTAGFAGACGSAWLWFDIDRAGDLAAALADARRLAAFVLARYPTLDDDDVLAFYSGSKGFHVGIPSSLWGPAPAGTFNRVARRFAERLAERAGVAIDGGVYDKVRAFRAPNSRHPKTGLHKRRLSHDELLGYRWSARCNWPSDPTPSTCRSRPAATNGPLPIGSTPFAWSSRRPQRQPSEG